MMYVVDAFATHDNEFPVNTWMFARMSDAITACINIMTNAESGISRIAITLPKAEETMTVAGPGGPWKAKP